MLTREQNELVTTTGVGTPGGRLLRQYWQPAALTEELTDARPLKPVRLLGEDLLLFRDEAGNYGVTGRQCPHRGADLNFGRLEDGGLRCPFHGWLFDVHGTCLQQPAEPAGSNFHAKVRLKSYPAREINGVVFT
ncbi:MAG: Rieske 2Fe-2S domain-containing protein, partial [Pseudomonadota bacterium]|nr:Rieske 2Fe-2S domain-containing protein [Pseudomonadota bacterium]